METRVNHLLTQVTWQQSVKENIYVFSNLKSLHVKLNQQVYVSAGLCFMQIIAPCYQPEFKFLIIFQNKSTKKTALGEKGEE